MESGKYYVVYEHYRVDAATGELKRYYQGCSEESEKCPGDMSYERLTRMNDLMCKYSHFSVTEESQHG